jgi:hypothetical protein
VKKTVLVLLIVVMCLSVVSIASATTLKPWSAAYTYDFPAGSFSAPDFIPYNFHFQWSYPTAGEHNGGNGVLNVSEEAPLYPGYVVVRGTFGTFAKDGDACGWQCLQLDEPITIHPDQAVRFHIAWRTDEGMSRQDAVKHFDSMEVTVDLGDGPLEMSQHRLIRQTEPDFWEKYICKFTME